MAGITGLVGKKLLVKRECPVFEASSIAGSLVDDSFTGFEYFSNGTEGPIGHPLGYLKGGQTIEVLEDYGVSREKAVDDSSIVERRTFYLARCKVMTPVAPTGDSNMPGHQYTYIKDQIVVVWVGVDEGATSGALGPDGPLSNFGPFLSLKAAGGSYFAETEAPITPPLELVNVGDAEDTTDSPEQEGQSSTSRSNLLFIGDGQIASTTKKVDRLRRAVKALYTSSKSPTGSNSSLYDTIYHRSRKSKSIYDLKVNASLSLRRKNGLRKRINTLNDPTEYVILSLGTEDMKSYDTRRGDFKAAAKSILETVADAYLDSLKTGAKNYQTLRSCKGIILIGIMPPREDSKLAYPPPKLNAKLTSNVTQANSVLKSLIKEIVDEKPALTSSKMWFVDPAEISNLGWTATSTSVSTNSSSSEKQGRYFYLTDKNAGKFVGVAASFGLFYINTNTNPLQDNLTPTDFSDWTQKVQSGEVEPYYVDEIRGQKVCEWYVPVKTVYNHTGDYRRYLPGEKFPGEEITLGGQPQASALEEKINEYRFFAYESLMRFVLGGEEQYQKWLSSPDGIQGSQEAQIAVNEAVFVCQPYEYRRRDSNGAAGELVDIDKVNINSANVAKLPKSVYNDPRTAGKLWLLYKVTDRNFKHHFEKYTRGASLIKSAQGQNYKTKIVLDVVKAKTQFSEIKQGFNKLQNIIDAGNHIVYANSQPAAQFSYKKDGDDLYNFYHQDLKKLLKNNNLEFVLGGRGPVSPSVLEIGLDPNGSATFCYLHVLTQTDAIASTGDNRVLDLFDSVSHTADFETYNLIRGFEQFKNSRVLLSGRMRGYLQTNILNFNNTTNLSFLIKELSTALTDASNPEPKQKWISWVKKFTFPTAPADPVVKSKPPEKQRRAADPGGAADVKDKVQPRKTLEQRLNAAKRILETNNEAYNVMFGKETKQEVGQLVNSPSFFTLIDGVTRVFGEDGLYDVVLNKTDWRVLVKTVAECMAIELEGDDLIEVLCNVVLQFTPIDELKEVVNQAVADGVADFKELTSQAIDEISKAIEEDTGFSPAFYSTISQEMMKSIDFSQELNFEMFASQVKIDPNGSAAEWQTMFNPKVENSTEGTDACSSPYDVIGESYKPISSTYSSSKKGALDEKFLFAESSRGYNNSSAVRVWQKLLWIMSQPSKRGGLNLGMLVPRGMVHDRWVDGKFGKHTAHATKIFLGRSYVSYKDFNNLFGIDTLKPGTQGNTNKTNHNLQMESLEKKIGNNDGSGGLNAVPGLNSLSPLKDPSSEPSKGDYTIQIQRISYDAFSLSQEFLISVFEYTSFGNLASKKLINRQIANSNAQAKEIASKFSRTLKRQKPSASIIIDNRDLKKFNVPEQMKSADEFRDFTVKALSYMDPATATDAIFKLIDAGGLETNKLMNKFFDRRQLCEMFSDAIQEMYAFFQDAEGNFAAALEEFGKMFEGNTENITAFFEDLGEGMVDFFESLGRAWVNAAVASLEAVIVALVKIAMQYLLIACKYVQRAIDLEIRDALAEPLRKTKGFKRLHGDQSEKGVSSEEGLMNIAEDMQMTEEGLKLLPAFPKDGEDALGALVTTLLADFGKSMDDLDNLTENIIPASLDTLEEMQPRMTPTELLSIVTADSWVSGETMKIVADVMADQPAGSEMKSFFKGELGFIEFLQYAGSFIKIPTIKQLEDIRTLDPCELIENPFLLEDLKLQQEKQKKDVKDNLQELLASVISPELTTEPDLNLGLPSNFYGIRDTFLDGIFDTIETVFNMEAASVPNIYITNSDPKALMELLASSGIPGGPFDVAGEMEQGIFDPQVSFTDEGNLDYFKTLAGYTQAFGQAQNDVTLFNELRTSMMKDSNYFWEVTPVAGSYQRYLKLDDGKVGASLGHKDVYGLSTISQVLSKNIRQKLDDEVEIFNNNNPEYELEDFADLAENGHLGSFAEGLQVFHYKFKQTYASTEFYAIESLSTNVRLALNINSDPTVEFSADSVFPLNLSEEGYKPEYGDTSAWAFGTMIKNSVYRTLTQKQYEGGEVYQSFFDEANLGAQSNTTGAKIIHDIRTNHFSPLSLSYFRKIGSIISDSPLLKTILPPAFNQHDVLAHTWSETFSDEMLAYTEDFKPAQPSLHSEYKEKPVMSNMFFATSLIRNVLNKCSDIDPPDILKMSSIKDLVGQRHKAYSDSVDFSKLPAKDNDLLQLASLEGILRLKFRVFILDYIFKSIFVYTEFKAENILNNASFYELILNQVQSHYGDSYFQSMLGLCYVIYERRLEAGEVFDEPINSGMQILRKMIAEELNEVSGYISSIVPAMAYKAYQEFDDQSLSGCAKDIVDLFWRLEEDEDIPDIISTEYVDKYFICPKIFDPPVFTALDLSNLKSDTAAVRNLPTDELAHVFEFDDILHNRVSNPRFAEKEILKYFTKPFEGQNSKGSSDQHGGFFLERYILVIDKKELDSQNPEAGPQSILDTKIRSLGGKYENFERSIDTIGVCNVSTFYGFLNGLRKDAINAPELGDPTLAEFEIPPDMVDFRYPGDEENIALIEEILDQPLDHFFEEFSYGLRLMYMPKPVDMVDLKNIDLSFLPTGEVADEFGAINQAPFSIPEIQKELAATIELSSIEMDQLNEKLNELLAEDNLNSEAVTSLLKDMAIANPVDNKFGKLIRDMLLENILIGSLSEQELRDKIAARVFEIEQMLLENPNDEFIVEFLGDSIVFSSVVVPDPTPLMNSAFDRLKDFFIRNKAYLINESYTDSAGNLRILQTTPIPVADSKRSIFELLPDKTLLDLSGEAVQPDAFVDVTFEKIYPSNQWISEAKGLMFTHGRAMPKTVSRYKPNNQFVAEVYRSIFGVLGDPSNKGSLSGPQKEARPDYPHGAFPLGYYMDDDEMNDMLTSAKIAYGGEEVSDLPAGSLLQGFHDNATFTLSPLYRSEEHSVSGITTDDTYDQNDPFHGNSYGPMEISYTGEPWYNQEDQGHFGSFVMQLPDGTTIHQHQLISSVDPGTGFPIDYVTFFTRGTSHGPIAEPFIDPGEDGKLGTEDDWSWNNIADCGKEDLFGATRCKYASRWDQIGAKKIITMVNPVITALYGKWFGTTSDWIKNVVQPAKPSNISQTVWDAGINVALTTMGINSKPSVAFVSNYENAMSSTPPEDWLTAPDYSEAGAFFPLTNNLLTWDVIKTVENSLSFVRFGSIDAYFENFNYQYGEQAQITNWKKLRHPFPPKYTIFEDQTGEEQGTFLGNGQWALLNPGDAPLKADLLYQQIAALLYYSPDVNSTTIATKYAELSRKIVCLEYEMEIFQGPLAGQTITAYGIVFDQNGGHVKHPTSEMYNIYWASPGYYPRHVESEYMDVEGWDGHMWNDSDEYRSPYGYYDTDFTIEGSLVRFPPQVDFRRLVDKSVDILFEKTINFYNWDINRYAEKNEYTIELVDGAPDEVAADYEIEGSDLYFLNPPGHQFKRIGVAAETSVKEQLEDVTFTVRDYVADIYAELMDGNTGIPLLAKPKYGDKFIYEDGRPSSITYVRRLLKRLLSTIELVDKRLLPHVNIYEYSLDSFSGNLYDALVHTIDGGGRAGNLLLIDIANQIGYIRRGIRDMRDAHLGILDLAPNPLDPLEYLRTKSFYGEGDMKNVIGGGQQGNIGPLQFLDHNSPEFFLGSFYDTQEAFSQNRRAHQTNLRYKINNPFIDVANDLSIYSLSEGERALGSKTPLIDCVEKVYTTPPHAAKANEDLILGINFGGLDEDDYSKQVEEILNAAGVSSTSNEAAQVTAQAELANSNVFEFYSNMLLHGWDGFGPWGQSRFGEFNPNILPMTLSPLDFERVHRIYNPSANEKGFDEHDDAIVATIDYLKGSPCLDPTLKTLVLGFEYDEEKLQYQLRNTGGTYSPDWITSFYLSSGYQGATEQAPAYEKYLLAGDASDSMYDHISEDTPDGVLKHNEPESIEAMIFDVLMPNDASRYYEIPSKILDDNNIGLYDVFIMNPSDIRKHRNATSRLLIWMTNPTLYNFGKWIDAAKNISYAIRIPVSTFIRASLVTVEGSQEGDTSYQGSSINSAGFVDTAVSKMKYHSPNGVNGQFTTDYLMTDGGQFVDDNGTTSIVLEGLTTILFGAFASVAKNGDSFVFSKSDEQEVKNLNQFAKLLGKYAHIIVNPANKANMSDREHYYTGTNVAVNGAEIIVKQEKVFENMGKNLLASEFSGVYEELLSDLKSSEEIEMLLKYIFPIEKMLYLLTNYIYQQVTTSRPAMHSMLDGTKGNIKNLMLTLSKSSQTFFKDKNTLDQLSKEVADSGEGNYADIDQEMKHFADMAVPMILRGVLQEVDPAWKVTKIAAQASGGKFKANEKCGYPFEPFNGKYSGNQWPLMFISTPIGLAASGIWTAVQPLPCRINEVPDMTCEDLTVEPCAEDE